MPFFPDITPLIKEAEEFNKNQHKVIALLKENNQLLKQLLTKK